MKYIRTKDKILPVLITKTTEPMFIKGKGELIGYWGYKNNGDYVNGEVLTKDIIKQADTIEELCDEFYIIDKERVRPMFDSLNNLKYFARHKMLAGNKGYCPFGCGFGAIWITLPNGGKRLEPVAKMNEKGELELL